jgi:hypothetical protein
MVLLDQGITKGGYLFSLAKMRTAALDRREAVLVYLKVQSNVAATMQFSHHLFDVIEHAMLSKHSNYPIAVARASMR